MVLTRVSNILIAEPHSKGTAATAFQSRLKKNNSTKHKDFNTPPVTIFVTLKLHHEKGRNK